MSCLLYPDPLLDELKGLDKLTSMNPSPLLFTFKSGHQPVGLFHALLNSLLAKFSLDEERYRNRVTLFFGSMNVEILSTPSNLEIRVTEADKEKCLEVKKLLWDQIHVIIAEVLSMKGVIVGLGLYCLKSVAGCHQSLSSSCEVHVATNYKPNACGGLAPVFRCKHKSHHPMVLEESHKIWFEDDLSVCHRVRSNKRCSNNKEEVSSKRVPSMPQVEPNAVKQGKCIDDQPHSKSHYLRSRSCSEEELPPMKKPLKAACIKLPDDPSSLQDSESVEVFVSGLRYYHSDICSKLYMLADTTLSCLGESLFGAEVIDETFKTSVLRNKTHAEISNLVCHVSDYLNEGGDDKLKRYEVVMKCLEAQEALNDIVKKIKEYQVQDDTKKPRLI